MPILICRYMLIQRSLASSGDLMSAHAQDPAHNTFIMQYWLKEKKPKSKQLMNHFSLRAVRVRHFQIFFALLPETSVSKSSRAADVYFTFPSKLLHVYNACNFSPLFRSCRHAIGQKERSPSRPDIVGRAYPHSWRHHSTNMPFKSTDTVKR